jgi:hypothetical protein
MAGKDEDLRPFADRLADGGAFFGAGDEEFAAACAGEGPCDAVRAQPIAVGLDYGARLGRRTRERVEGAPVQ